MDNNNIDAKIISILSSAINGDKMDIERLTRQAEDYMNIKKIETEYGKKIQQMPNGLWWIRLDNGKVIKRTTRENVINKLIALEEETNLITINGIWNDFLQHRQLTCSDGTWGKNILHYETYIKGQTISNLPLDKISFNDCEHWAKQVLEIKRNMPNSNITPKYFSNVRGTLSQIFEYAKIHKLMSDNPALMVEIHQDNLSPKKAHHDEDDIFLYDEEIAVKKLAYKEAQETENALPLAIVFLFLTGIRDGELCALHWRDINFNTMKLHVQGELVEQRNEAGKTCGYKYVSHTKTSAGDRYISLNNEAIAILKEVKKYNLLNQFGISQNDFVFQRIYRKKVTFCTTRCFEPRLKRYCKEAGMEVLKSQHDIRRTFATNLYSAGMNIKVISAIMGHESITQTEAYIKANLTDAKDIQAIMETLSQKDNRNKSEQKIV